jgi:hypothetical protein
MFLLRSLKSRNSGRGSGVKRTKQLIKKEAIFFNGEVFFLLTAPLMGDPISLYIDEIQEV